MSQFRFLQQIGAAPEVDEELAGSSLVDQDRLKQELDNKRGNLFADGKNIDVGKARQAQIDYLKQIQSPNEYPEREDTKDLALTQPWYSPDELVAGAMAPGIQKLGSAAIKSAPKILGNEAGVVSLEGIGTRVGKALDVKEGDSIVDAAKKSLIHKLSDVGLSGRGLVDTSGRTDLEYLKYLYDEAADMNVPIIEKKLGGNVLGSFSPEKRIITLNDRPESAYHKMGVLAHELEHVYDNNLGGVDPNKFANEAEFNIDKLKEIQKYYPDQLKMKTTGDHVLFQKVIDEVNRLKDSGEINKAIDLLNAVKKNHFIGHKNFELESTLKPLYNTAKSLTPEEINLGNKFTSLSRLMDRKKLK